MKLEIDDPTAAINYLACALAVLRNTAGGYTLEEKQSATEFLSALFQNVVAKHIQEENPRSGVAASGE